MTCPKGIHTHKQCRIEGCVQVASFESDRCEDCQAEMKAALRERRIRVIVDDEVRDAWGRVVEDD